MRSQRREFFQIRRQPAVEVSSRRLTAHPEGIHLAGKR